MSDDANLNDTFFEVQLEDFEGPIDLLLHLVKSHRLAIERVSLAAVSEQYLACIDKMRKLDLDVASEYLVVAATLLSIKTSLLLEDPIDESSLVLGEDGPDPHRELLEKLKAAAVFKEGAEQLGERKLLGSHVFATPSSLSSVPTPDVKFKPHDPFELGKIFAKILDRTGEAFKMTFSIDPVSVVDRMMGMLDTVRVKLDKLQSGAVRAVSFREIIPQNADKGVVVTSFVGMLELCKRSVFNIEQKESFGPISIGMQDDSFDGKNIKGSEFDSKMPLEEENTSEAATANM